MGCLGVFFAISPKQEKRLWAACRDEGDEGVRAVVAEIEEAWDEDHLCQTDKAWDAIHRCLTNDHTPGGQLTPGSGRRPLKLLILGGTMLHDGDSYTVNFIDKEHVPALAAALAKIDEVWLRKRFF